MSRAPIVRPPRIAGWVVDLFTPDESIAGDLLEEFSQIASKSGVAAARSWYWRQSVKSAVHLICTGFRMAPLQLAGAILMGFFLQRFGYRWPEQAIVAVLDFRRHHVTPYYTWLQVQTYLFWLGNGILIGRLLMSLFVGCIVAAATKGREMVATMALGCVVTLMTGMMFLHLVTRHWPEDAYLLPLLVEQVGSASMIVLGGVLVRESRSNVSRRPLSA
jgi:hypothetical protein